MTRSDYWIERSLRAMGTTARIIVGDAPDALVDWAVGEIAQLENTWTRFRPESELAALNASSGEWTHVSARLAIALECAEQLWRATGGAFDPTIIDALEASGYDRSFEHVEQIADRPVPCTHSVPGFGAVELRLDQRLARVPVGVRIDLGGVGKGLAADLLAEGLVDRGARTALVSIGGDMRVAGEAPVDGWPVPVTLPGRREPAFVHVLRSGALVQSTCLIRSWIRNGSTLHHIIDPQTGASATTDVASVVVAGDEAWRCEGLAKAAIVQGLERGREQLNGEHVRSWMFDHAGRLINEELSSCSPR